MTKSLKIYSYYSITIVQTQQHSVILPYSTPSFCRTSLRYFARFNSVILSSFTRFLDLSLGGFHSAVVPSDGLEPRHVTGRIDIWTEMCDRRKCNDTFRSIPSSVLLTAATAGAHPSSDRLRGSLGGWEGMFDASPETARRLIALGRKDARKVLAEAGIGFGVGQLADSAK